MASKARRMLGLGVDICIILVKGRLCLVRYLVEYNQLNRLSVTKHAEQLAQHKCNSLGVHVSPSFDTQISVHVQLGQIQIFVETPQNWGKCLMLHNDGWL